MKNRMLLLFASIVLGLAVWARPIQLAERPGS